jgi:hypothetical protein
VWAEEGRRRKVRKHVSTEDRIWGTFVSVGTFVPSVSVGDVCQRGGAIHESLGGCLLRRWGHEAGFGAFFSQPQGILH